MGLLRDKRSRNNRKKLRYDHIDQKQFKGFKNALNRAVRLYGETNCTVYVLNNKYYAGIKSDNEYLKSLESSQI